MATLITTGLKVVWGIPKEQKPIVGLPPGKVRLRFRSGFTARAFVRTESGVQHFVLLENGGTWGLMKQGENRTIPKPKPD